MNDEGGLSNDSRSDDESGSSNGSRPDDEGGSPNDARPANDGRRTGDEPPATDEDVVAAAVDAAEGVILSRYRSSEIRDVDVTVRVEDDVVEIDVYLNVPDAEDEERVADDAALAALDAVDALLE